MAPSSASPARTRWRFARQPHRRGRTPSPHSKQGRTAPRLTVGRPPLSPRRDAEPDDARPSARPPNPVIGVEHAAEIGTREPYGLGIASAADKLTTDGSMTPGDGHDQASQPVGGTARRTPSGHAPRPGDTTRSRHPGFAHEPPSRGTDPWKKALDGRRPITEAEKSRSRGGEISPLRRPPCGSGRNDEEVEPARRPRPDGGATARGMTLGDGRPENYRKEEKQLDTGRCLD